MRRWPGSNLFGASNASAYALPLHAKAGSHPSFAKLHDNPEVAIL